MALNIEGRFDIGVAHERLNLLQIDLPLDQHRHKKIAQMIGPVFRLTDNLPVDLDVFNETCLFAGDVEAAPLPVAPADPASGLGWKYEIMIVLDSDIVGVMPGYVQRCPGSEQ